MAPKWRLLTSVANMVEAEILKSALESADIPVSLKWESFNAVLFGTSANGPGTQVDVFVPEEVWEEAQAYLTFTD
ncbi:Putative signal transducing protein [Desulforamulus aeronauticus DSM 10349]|uniref:Putative signal transducing protein n=1 Tax=Desulforamulus aeronauticus DSM 10349 TaxID=1121421 RepID=A0A1M6QWU2_9FIRM|nr:Putative signal transducing protein [Desulforamulus aeronauticus DSM 10349]